MEIDTKVVAAIGAAVTTYIEEERAAARELPAPLLASAWTLSGRQEIMRNRQMWQIRIVPR